MRADTASARDVDRDYRGSMALVLSHLRRRFPALEADERLEIYDEAWAKLLERQRNEGFWPKSLEPWLVQTAENHVVDELRSAEARVTDVSDPLEGALALQADAPMDERVMGELAAEDLRSIITSLSEGQRQAAKLRFDWGLSPREIAEVLGISRERVYNDLNHALRHLRRRGAKVRDGEHVRAYDKVLRRHIAGTASESERAEALHLLATSSQAKMIAAEIARQARDLGAVLPAPALAVDDSRGRALELAAAVKQQISDTAASVKQHALATASRVDPTPLGGARPGTAATLIVGCLAVGGGGAAYCVDQGINPIDAVRGSDQRAELDRREEAKAPLEPKLPLGAVELPAKPGQATLDADAKLDGAPQAVRKLEPSAPSAPSGSPAPPRQSAPSAQSTRPGEFDPAGSSAGGPGDAAPVQPSVPAPAPSGGGGEFGP